jgi:hypothetical protein
MQMSPRERATQACLTRDIPQDENIRDIVQDEIHD